MCCSTVSPLDTLEMTFRHLASGPQPLALEGPAVRLPIDSVGLLDVRARVFHPATGVGVQRAVLGEMVRRARQYGGAWVVGLAGILLPGLQRRAAWYAAGCAGAGGADQMVLADLLEELDAPEVSCEEVAERLLWTVVRSPVEPVICLHEGTA